MSERRSVLLFLLSMGCASLLLGGTRAANFTLMNMYQRPHTEAEIGHPVRFNCEFSYIGDSDISEMMFAKFYTQGNHTVDYNANVMCHHSVYNDTMSCSFSQTINPSPTDENVYYCEVLIPRPEGSIEVRGKGTYLSLYAEPTSIEIRSVPLLITRRSAMLLCLASGFYPGNLSVRWFHRGQPVAESRIYTDIIRESDGTFYLHSSYRFIPTEADHTGPCVCQLFHPAWKKQWTAGITLNVSLEPISMGIQPLSYLVSGNQSVLLCTASQFFPGNPSVLWFHQTHPVPPSSITNDITGESDGTFSLRSQYRFIPTESDHSTQCFCQISHEAWTQLWTANITLNVHYGPSAVSVISDLGSVTNNTVSVAPGSTVNLSCASKGNPVPKMQWLRGNITELHSTECLYIPSVQKEDEGLYWCMAQNLYGKRNTSITLQVWDSDKLNNNTYSNSGVSTCLLVKLLLIGILILVDVIMFTIFVIRRTKMRKFEVMELSVSQATPPEGERPSSQTSTVPEPHSSSSSEIPQH